MNSVDFSYPKIRNMWKGYFLSIPIDQEEFNMAQSVFMKADEEEGFIVLSGRVSRKYLAEMIYGYPSISDANKEEG